jgi:hypothetical protein
MVSAFCPIGACGVERATDSFHYARRMARATRVLGLALAALGFVPIAYAVVLVGWQTLHWLQTHVWAALPLRLLVDPALFANPHLAGIAPLIPSAEWTWANHPRSLILANKLLGVVLDRVHIGVLAVAAGYGLITLGRAIAERQALIIEWQDRQRADRRRRAAQYAAEARTTRFERTPMASFATSTRSPGRSAGTVGPSQPNQMTSSG